MQWAFSFFSVRLEKNHYSCCTWGMIIWTSQTSKIIQCYIFHSWSIVLFFQVPVNFCFQLTNKTKRGKGRFFKKFLLLFSSFKFRTVNDIFCPIVFLLRFLSVKFHTWTWEDKIKNRPVLCLFPQQRGINWCTWNGRPRLGKGARRVSNRMVGWLVSLFYGVSTLFRVI